MTTTRPPDIILSPTGGHRSLYCSSRCKKEKVGNRRQETVEEASQEGKRGEKAGSSKKSKAAEEQLFLHSGKFASSSKWLEDHRARDCCGNQRAEE